MFDLLKKGYALIRSDGIIVTFWKGYKYILFPMFTLLVTRTVDLTLGRRKDILLFGGSTYGRGNSKYVFEWVCANRPDLSPVWITSDPEVYSNLQEQDLPVCKKYSIAGAYFLGRAKIGLISNSFRDIAPSKRALPDSLLILFLDHGSPVKFGEKAKSKSGRQKRERIDYQIKLSEFHIKKRVKYPKANEPTYITTGFPRNDVLFESDQDLSSLEVRIPEGSTTILYAPTKRRADRWNHPVELFPFDDFELTRLFDFLNKNDIYLLINLHPTSMEQLSSSNLQKWSEPLQKKIKQLSRSDRVLLTSNDTFVQANELMASSDILITDYSSMYHDYLLLDRPIMFFPYDYDEFDQKLGFSYEYYDNLPGPDIESFEEFIHYTRQLLKNEDPHSKDRRELQEKMHAHIDNRSTERVVNVIDAIRNDKSVSSVDDVTAI